MASKAARFVSNTVTEVPFTTFVSGNTIAPGLGQLPAWICAGSGVVTGFVSVRVTWSCEPTSKSTAVPL
jgi:hypothetical protein